MFLLWISSAACCSDFGTSFLKLLFEKMLPLCSLAQWIQLHMIIHLQFLAFELDIIQSAFLIYKDTCTIYMYMWRHLWNIFLVCYQSLCEQPLYPVLWSLKHVFPSYWLPGNHHIVAVSFFNFPWTFSFISCQKRYKFMSCKKKHY